MPPPAPPAPNQIQVENARPGTVAWQRAGSSAIEGYASEVTVAPGEQLHVHVSTAARYRVEVFRLGWYGGAGARLVACSPACDRDETAPAQPRPSKPPSNPLGDVVRAWWWTSDTIAVGPDWTSGYYVAEFVLTTGPDAGRAASAPFVVRDSQSATASQILVQVPVNTWQAYNQWGGKSLYDFGTTRAYRVSFDRPYGTFAQSPMWWEIQLVRFLEREGYDVSYQTDIDTDRDPGSLLRHQLAMTAGHDEYWTLGMRNAFDAARDAGTNLAFMGSNTGYWVVQYQDDYKTIFSYKSTYDPNPDPSQKTSMFRELVPARPECELMGVQHRYLRPHQDGPVDYTVTDAAASDPWFANTGLQPGDVVRNVVGDEWDALNPWPADQCEKPGLVVLFHYQAVQGSDDANADAVRYTAPSGARVFASGAQRFSWGLDDFGTRYMGGGEPPDPRLQQFVRNMLDDLTRPASPTELRLRYRGLRVRIWVPPSTDPRIAGIAAFRKTHGQPPVPVCSGVSSCIDTLPGPGRYRYGVVYVNVWSRASAPLISRPVFVSP